MHYLEEALTVTDDPAEQAALHERAAHSAFLQNVDAALDHAQAAISLYQQVGDTDSALRSTAFAAQSQLSLGRGSETIAVLEGILATTDESAPDWAQAMGQLARAYMLTQRNDEAVATADRALAAIGSRRLPQLTADILSTRGTALQKRPDEAEAILRGAVALAERSGHLPTIMRARNNLLSVQAGEIPLNQAAAYLVETADIGRRGGDAHFLSQMLLSLADTYIEAGTWSAAEAPLEELAGMDLDSWRVTWYLTTSGLFEAFRGNRIEAERILASIQERVETVDTFWAENVISSRAMFLIGMGDMAQAVDLAMSVAGTETPDYFSILVAANAVGAVGVGRSLELVAAIDRRPPTRAAAATRAQVAALTAVAEGNWDQARSSWSTALEGFDSLDMGYWRALAGLQFDAYLGQRFPDARQAGVDAGALFAANGAESFVDRYRAAFRGTPAPAADAAASPERATSEVPVS